MIPTLPLRPRNRLAETILHALHDPEARRALQALASGAGAEGWLDPAPPTAAELLRLRAQRAVAAIARLRPAAPDPPLAEALEQAAALFDAGLGFEVHELLERHWVRARGAERSALQGLIQIAVGYQHLANGNRVGAQALLEEGSARVRGHRLAGVDLDPFARAVANATRHLGPPGSNERPDFPRARNEPSLPISPNSTRPLEGGHTGSSKVAFFQLPPLGYGGSWPAASKIRDARASRTKRPSGKRAFPRACRLRIVCFSGPQSQEPAHGRASTRDVP